MAEDVLHPKPDRETPPSVSPTMPPVAPPVTPPTDAAEHTLAQELRQIRNLELKAMALLLAFLLLLGGSAAYVLYARGAFEPTNSYWLLIGDADGVSIGMDVSFAGFPIGRVSNTELAPDGQVRIQFEVPVVDSKWLRQSSVAIIEKGIVGGAKLKIVSNDISQPALKPGSQITQVLRGDLSAELPQVVAQATQLLTNVTALTQADAALNQSLVQMSSLIGGLQGEKGVLGGLMGSEKEAQKLVQTIDQANALLKRWNQISGKAEQQVFGQGGVVPGVQQSVGEINAMLVEARKSLKKVDQVLADATVISGNAKAASGDLEGLRNEVDASLRKVDRLITDLNRKWPFAPADKEVKLP